MGFRSGLSGSAGGDAATTAGHVPQLPEADLSKMTLLMAAEDQTQNLFRQPAIKNSQLAFIIHVLQIIIKDSHISKAVIDGLRGNHDQELGAGSRVGDLLPAAASAAEGKAKKIPYLAQLVARECDRSSSAKQQTQMAKLGSSRKDGICRRTTSEQKIGPARGLQAQSKARERSLH